jgi:cation diffusion facilitator family transporter
MAGQCCAPPPLDPAAGRERYRRQRRVLWVVLVINATMFFVEITAGWLAGSTALLADALDFLADSATYGLTLYVLARSMRWKVTAALIKGGAMGLFGIWVMFEAARRAFDPALPDAATMGLVGAMALAANTASAVLLFWHRSDDINMRSVWLCSRNDAIANLLVIGAAGGVFATATAWPDLAVGALIAGLELSAARSILREALAHLRTERTAQAGAD